ncbi:MAG: PDZ domain-containing protein [bacterium]|nr:PDZ domain-containing protein [bacterium]
MTPTMSARRVLALVCVLGLVAAAGTALADDKEDGEKSGYLGVHLQSIDSSMAKALQLDDDEGVLISQVVDDGPAATAGLEDGDVVLEFNGKDIEDVRDLTRAVRRAEPGETVEVVVLREGKRQTLDVEVGEREHGFVWVHADGDDDTEIDVYTHLENLHEGDSSFFYMQMKDGDDLNVYIKGHDEDRGYMGVHLDDLNEQLGEYFDIEDGEGALVTEVVEDSAAEAAGLRAGDVIVKMGDEDIASASDVTSAMQHTEVDQEIEVKVKRKGKTETFDVKLGEMPDDFFGKNIQFFGDGDNYRIVAPKMLRRMPHMQRQMRVHAPEHLEVIREFHDQDDDLDEVREELEQLRMELKDLQKELKK